MERLMLGKALYQQLLAEADAYAKDGPPPTMAWAFSFSGKNADAFAEVLAAKFDEYAYLEA
jgi:hypothetical protein